MVIIDRNYEMMIFNVRYQKANQRQTRDLLTLQSKNNESAQLRQVSDQISLVMFSLSPLTSLFLLLLLLSRLSKIKEII